MNSLSPLLKMAGANVDDFLTLVSKINPDQALTKKGWLKVAFDMLKDDLIDDCSTGVDRAERISRIINLLD